MLAWLDLIQVVLALGLGWLGLALMWIVRGLPQHQKSVAYGSRSACVRREAHCQVSKIPVSERNI